MILNLFRSFKKKRSIPLDSQGEHHHLNDILFRINHEYFAGKLNLKITWFNRRRSSFPRRITLGSYHFRLELIRINRYLDQSHIPDYFVAYIVYHEALHHVVAPVKGKRGKRRIHHPGFKTLEKKFKYYQEAQEFKAHLRKQLFG